jgi:hypothetical protein
MDVLQHHWAQLLSLAAARGADLAAFATLVQSSASTGQLPELSQVPQQVLYTGGTAVALALLLLVPRGRRLLFDTADTAVATVAAIALLLVLIATLLSVPLGERLGMWRAGGAGYRRRWSSVAACHAEPGPHTQRPAHHDPTRDAPSMLRAAGAEWSSRNCSRADAQALQPRRSVLGATQS